MTPQQERCMVRQREARLAQEAERAAQVSRDAIRGGSAQDFWDLVDTSAGADECHPWTGRLNTTWATYDLGEFKIEGITTDFAHRIVCALVFGSEIPRGNDVIPICDNRLCCNVDHLATFPHGSKAEMKMVREYYCQAN